MAETLETKRSHIGGSEGFEKRYPRTSTEVARLVNRARAKDGRLEEPWSTDAAKKTRSFFPVSVVDRRVIRPIGPCDVGIRASGAVIRDSCLRRCLIEELSGNCFDWTARQVCSWQSGAAPEQPAAVLPLGFWKCGGCWCELVSGFRAVVLAVWPGRRSASIRCGCHPRTQRHYHLPPPRPRLLTTGD